MWRSVQLALAGWFLAMAVPRPSGEARAATLVGDQAVGYVSALSNGLDSINYFETIVNVIGNGVEFTGTTGSDLRPSARYDADFDESNLTVSIYNIPHDGATGDSLYIYGFVWEFTDLDWLPDAQEIVGITTTGDTFPDTTTTVEYSSADDGSNRIIVRQSGIGGGPGGHGMASDLTYMASFQIHTQALPDYFEFRSTPFDQNWHTLSAGESNWEDAGGNILGEAPGDYQSNDRVHIDSAVVLDQRDVVIGKLTGWGTLTLSKSLTLTRASDFDDLIVESTGILDPQANVEFDDVINRGQFVVRNTVSLFQFVNESTGVVDRQEGSILDLSFDVENYGTIQGVGTIVGDIENYGTLAGEGTIVGEVENYAHFTPGSSPGVYIIDGNFLQYDGGILTLEVTPTGYDQVIVTDQALLGGVLEILFTEGYVPPADTQFDLFSVANETYEAFDEIRVVGLDSSYYTSSLDGGLFQITIVGDPSGNLAGDYNNDGVVDAADYTVWRGDYGATDHDPWTVADGDGDGDADGADFLVWQRQYGMTLADASSSAGSTTVPEPSSLACLILLLSLACMSPSSAGIHLRNHSPATPTATISQAFGSGIVADALSTPN